MARRDKIFVWLLVSALAVVIAGLAHFLFGAPWWVAIAIAILALVINGWVAG
jgi:hypothetical protein